MSCVFSCFLAVFNCFFVYLSANSLVCGGACASSFFALCEPMSACYALFCGYLFARCFCEGALRASFFEKNDLFCDFFDEKALSRLI